MGMVSTVRCDINVRGDAMKRSWLTADELAAELKVSVKSIRRAYRTGEIPVERFWRFVRFDLERVKETMQANGHGQSLVVSMRRPGRLLDIMDSAAPQGRKLGSFPSDGVHRAPLWGHLHTFLSRG